MAITFTPYTSLPNYLNFSSTTAPTAPQIPQAFQLGNEQQQYMTNALAGYEGMPVIQSQLAGQLSSGAVRNINQAAAQRGLLGYNADAIAIADTLGQTQALQQAGLTNLATARSTVPQLSPTALSSLRNQIYTAQLGEYGATNRAQLAAMNQYQISHDQIAAQQSMEQARLATQAQIAQAQISAQQQAAAQAAAQQAAVLQQARAQQEATNAALQDILNRYSPGGAVISNPTVTGTSAVMATPTTQTQPTQTYTYSPTYDALAMSEAGYDPTEIESILGGSPSIDWTDIPSYEDFMAGYNYAPENSYYQDVYDEEY